LDRIFLAKAIGIFGRYRGGKNIAYVMAFNDALKSGDNVVVAV
jgi:hypothetical protein